MDLEKTVKKNQMMLLSNYMSWSYKHGLLSQRGGTWLINMARKKKYFDQNNF